ncbi:MAG: hypothetical protein R6U70_10685 [Bacillota bacterium]
MPSTSGSAEVSNRCMLALKEAGVADKVLWLVEIQPLDVFAKSFPDVAHEVLVRAEDAGHNFVVYHHQQSQVTELATFNNESSADLRLACRQLAECLLAKNRQRRTDNRYVVECEYCGGRGVVTRGDTNEECPACEGTGCLPTTEGLELIDALEALRPWWKGHQEC